MKKVYLNTTWFVDGDGYRGMVEVCRPSVEPETIHCEKIRSDIPEALADAEALKLNMQAAAPELLAACKLAQEKIYQRCEGSCPYCGEQDYPVKGDKKGYDEVLPEDAEEYHLDHAEDCIVTKIDIAIAKAKKE